MTQITCSGEGVGGVGVAEFVMRDNVGEPCLARGGSQGLLDAQNRVAGLLIKEDPASLLS